MVEWIREKNIAIASDLDERGRRRWAAAEARSLGWGGISAVAEASGISDRTIRTGIRAFFASALLILLCFGMHTRNRLRRNSQFVSTTATHSPFPGVFRRNDWVGADFVLFLLHPPFWTLYQRTVGFDSFSFNFKTMSPPSRKSTA